MRSLLDEIRSQERSIMDLCVNKGKLPKKFLENVKVILNLKEKKLSKQEIEKARKESHDFLRTLIEHMQSKRGAELERARIRVKYGEKFGEVYLLDDKAYIVNDIDAAKKEISKADVLPSGGLGNILDSKLEEFEDAISKTRVPKNVFIKEKIFEDLRKLFGKDVQIMVG